MISYLVVRRFIFSLPRNVSKRMRSSRRRSAKAVDSEPHTVKWRRMAARTSWRHCLRVLTETARLLAASSPATDSYCPDLTWSPISSPPTPFEDCHSPRRSSIIDLFYYRSFPLPLSDVHNSPKSLPQIATAFVRWKLGFHNFNSWSQTWTLSNGTHRIIAPCIIVEVWRYKMNVSLSNCLLLILLVILRRLRLDKSTSWSLIFCTRSIQFHLTAIQLEWYFHSLTSSMFPCPYL